MGDTVFCKSCWELLGVEDVASKAEIKAAYREALREIEPQDADSIDLRIWALDKALRLTTP